MFPIGGTIRRRPNGLWRYGTLHCLFSRRPGFIVRFDRWLLILVLPGMLLLAGGGYRFYSAQQDYRHLHCHLPLTVLDGQLWIGGCDRLLAVTTSGDIASEQPLKVLGMEGALYGLSGDASRQTLLATDMGKSTLFRCDESAQSCEADNGSVDGVRRPFAVIADGQTDWLVAPENDRIDWLGGDLALPASLRFKYPHGLARSGDLLWVADAGNERLVGLRFDDGVAQLASEWSMRELGDGLPSHPVAVAAGNGSIWVVLADHLMTGRAVVELDAEGSLLTQAKLPEGAEPFALVVNPAFGVIVSDPARHALYSVDTDGSTAEAFAADTPVATYFDGQRQRLYTAKNEQWLGYILFCAGIFALYAYRRRQIVDEERQRTPVTAVVLTPEPKNVVWLRPQGQLLMMVILVAMILVWIPLFLGLRLLTADDLSSSTVLSALLQDWHFPATLFLAAIAMVGVSLYQMHYRQPRIAGFDGSILVRWGRGPVNAYDPQTLEYSDNVLLMGRKHITLRNQGLGGYRLDELTRHILPLLADARYLTNRQAMSRVQGSVMQANLSGVFLVVLFGGLAWALHNFFIV